MSDTNGAQEKERMDLQENVNNLEAHRIQSVVLCHALVKIQKQEFMLLLKQWSNATL